ncbi:collagen alpha-6(VI) chain-like isoform X3 [Clavelina lepadiformis]|uniref:collagen alpha-6(VI) chain-like isoform X3 n=1 Tax=Clavelina lepadiformis TaxID=159417 RepID=UPI00404304D5
MAFHLKPAILFILTAFITFHFGNGQMFDGIPGCRTTKLELVFLVDGSTSVSHHDFSLAKSWIRNMTFNFDISRYTTRVAVIQYSSYPRTEFGLTSYDNGESVRRAVSGIEYMSGSTLTGMALRYAIERVFIAARDGSARVAIVLSDGESQDRVNEAAQALKTSGISIFAVGVGDMSSSDRVQQLRAISSSHPQSNDNVFMVKDFLSIGRIQRRLIDAVCEQTVQECPTAKHDLTFVIDSSSTIGYDDFVKVKNWMKKIVNAFDIGPDQTRVAVVQYSTTIQEEFNFNDLLTKQEVLDAIDFMEYRMGNTRTGEALMHMLNVIYNEENGDRPDVPDMAIVMTDGKAQDSNYVKAASQRVQRAGITVYAVGVADYSLDEVKVIASDPDETYVMEALNFDLIELKRVGLIKSICQELEPTCPTASAEIVFLVDGSTSIGSHNFEKTKTWLKTIVDAFQVGQYYTRIGVVQFTENPHLEFGLDEHRSTQSALQAIQNIRYRRGSTNIGRAIDFTLKQVLSESRPNVPKILVVLTDGQSRDNARVAADRAREAGVHTLVFGVASAQAGQLRQMVSASENVFHAAGFDEIQRVQRKLVSLICVEAEPECARQDLDLHFLVDGSSSIGEENFDKIKTWIKTMVRSFDVGRYTTRVALTQFSAAVYPEFNLQAHGTEREVAHAIDQVSLRGGPTMFAHALNYIRQSGFAEDSGGRRGAPKVLIVITDGRSGEEIENAVAQLRKSGIHVFSVGAGYMSRSALQMIGSEFVVPHVQDISSYDVINNFRRDLVGEICRETKPECPNTEMDLIFLVDGSNSVGRSNFETTKEWIVSFVREFEIGEYNSKIGVVQYSSGVRPEIEVGAYENKEELIRAITRIEFAAGSTNTGSALEYVRSVAFSIRHGARKGVPKVLIILTDGNAQDQVTEAARSLHRVGVRVYAIGVGRANMGQLKSSMILNEPGLSNVLHVKNFDSIKTVQSHLLRSVCEDVEPDCDSTTSTDIMFLIDGSTSVGHADWTIVKSFMQNITEKFRIGSDLVHVGVVQYSTYPRTSIIMGDYNDKEDLRDALTGMDWQTGDTYTARALRYVQSTYNRAAAGSNRKAKKLLIVITDGQPQDRLEVVSAVRDLHESGWRIFAIGVGQAVLSELGDLASNPDSDHVFYANNYNSTKKFQGRLTRLICSDPSVEDLERSTQNPFVNVRNSLNAFLESSQERRTNYQESRGSASLRSHITSNTKSRYANSKVVASPAPLVNSVASTSAPKTAPVDVSCPVFRRDGKKVTGADILASLGLKDSSFSSKATSALPVTSRRGTTQTLEAYRLQQGSLPVIPFETVFHSGMPSHFSTITVFRMVGRAIKDRWTLLKIVSSNFTIFSITFNGRDRSLYISRASARSSSPVQTVALKGRLISTLFDRKFHKMEAIVEGDTVTIMIDCLQVPSQMKFDTLPPDYTASQISFIKSTRLGTTIELQDLTIVCGSNDAEQCCELPGKKCSTSPTNNDDDNCGCLPALKTIEVREAEEEVITEIATRIANKIVKEKLNKMVKLLDLDPETFARSIESIQ